MHLQHSATHTRNLQEMFQLPNISVLELCVERRGHVYGAIALDILRICNATQKLKLVIDRSMVILHLLFPIYRVSRNMLNYITWSRNI